ncbi:MAG: prolyl oligopeptidase family serine peptidase [Myxococcales bacterium]
MPDGTGGKTAGTGTGGASTGSGGADPTGSGGDAPTGSGGDAPTGSGGAGPTGSGGDAPAGSGGAGPTGSGGRVGAGSGGMGGTSDPSGDIWGGLKNPPRKSAGCDKPATLTNGKKTITSGGMPREYVIDIPANYDPATPYRLLYVGHGIPGMASDVPPGWWAWKSVATAANVPAIWIAPGALNGVRGAWSTADNRDHVLFDDILAAAEAGLCVDTTRVFAMGMSGGGMLTNALTSDRQNKIRAGVAMAPTNFNIWLPNPPLKDPVAWMQTTGMSDNTCAWVANEAQMRGSKFIGLAKAANNGCTPAEIPTWKSGPHVCYDFAGCKPGYPTKVCTFNGPHTHISTDPGSNVNWIAKEGWAFLMQF